MFRYATATRSAVLTGAVLSFAAPALADESVFGNGLEPDERESTLYVWTRDADGAQSDFLAVVDVDPESDTYGEVVATAPTGSAANEAHHFGYTASSERIFAGGLFSNQLFIYDVGGDPRKPELIRTVDLDPTGYSGPHTMYAVPGGVMIAMLGAVDGGGPAGLIKLDDDGNVLEAYPQIGHSGAPEYMYDVGVKPSMNLMITSAFAHPEHAKMMGGSPPKHTGNEVVVWNWETKEIRRVVELDKAPLEVRWMHGPEAHAGFINCAYGSTVWHWRDANSDGRLEFERVIRLPEGSSPVDMRISYDNRYLYLSNFSGNSVQQYDISNPLEPELLDSIEVPHPNMMKLSPDSERLYVSNSLMSTMDPDENFHVWLFHVGPDGITRDAGFEPDFTSFTAGPAGPHDMLLK